MVSLYNSIDYKSYRNFSKRNHIYYFIGKLTLSPPLIFYNIYNV